MQKGFAELKTSVSAILQLHPDSHLEVVNVSAAIDAACREDVAYVTFMSWAIWTGH